MSYDLARARTEFSLDGLEPDHVFAPGDADEIARVLAECNAQQRTVIAWGGGTMQHLGALPARMDAVISTENLNRVVEYEPADLTVTVQAGMTLAEIQKTLAAHGQFLPLDVPQPERATIGGILAVGASGALRLHYGPPRDFTLGLRVATVEGHVIKAGGKVVKNVAGYELTKLLVGSFGTLGIITQATFKIFPKPAAELTLLASFESLQDACAAITKLWNLHTPPLALELFDDQIAAMLVPNLTRGWTVAVRFGGAKVTMDAARANAERVVEEFAPLNVAFAEERAEFWQGVADLPHSLAEEANAILVRIGAAPKELRAMLEIMWGIVPNPRVFAHAASAIVYASFAGDNAVEKIRQLRSALDSYRAYVVVESAPAEIKRTLDVWGDAGASLKLMRALKKQFDPNGILNRGRFVGGM
jgi:glycolate oxidase FAD binding subunit